MKESINIDRVPYGLAVHDSEEEEAVLEVIKNHKTIIGDNVKLFEKKVSGLFGKERGIMVNSGSSANLLAMELLDCPKNSEVITPILTFATTLSPILKKELIPVFVDVEESSCNIDVNKIKDAITDKTKANIYLTNEVIMKLGILSGYSGKVVNLNIDSIKRAESMGYDSVWTAEAYGSDAVTPATWILANTDKIRVGTAIMQMPARSPACTAMTAMTLNQLSNVRFRYEERLDWKELRTWSSPYNLNKNN